MLGKKDERITFEEATTSPGLRFNEENNNRDVDISKFIAVPEDEDR